VSVETQQLVRHGTSTTDQFGQKMRTDPAAVDGAVNAHGAMREQMSTVQGSASAGRANLEASSAGNTTDTATATSVSLEQEVQEVLDLSTELESAAVEAAAALDVGKIQNEQLRDEIVKHIGETMEAVAATRQQPPPGGPAAAQQLLTELVAWVEEKNGEAATVAANTLGTLEGIAGKLGGGSDSTSASGAAGGTETQVGQSFNNQGSSGGGSDGGGGAAGGGGSVSKPRLPVAIPPQPGTGVDVNLPDGSTVKAPNETAAKAVRAALSNLGVPYVWGGTKPGVGLDCSGLTMTSYGEAGLEIPRIANTQTVGAEVPSQADLLPGDLVVWSGHVAMVIGNGQMVEAGDPVQVGPIRTTNAGQSFIGFYRPTG